MRLYYRPVGTNGRTSFLRKTQDNFKKVLIIGAGTAAEMLKQKIDGNANLRYNVKGFINESGLYETSLDLLARFPYINVESMLGSVQNKTVKADAEKQRP